MPLALLCVRLCATGPVSYTAYLAVVPVTTQLAPEHTDEHACNGSCHCKRMYVSVEAYVCLSGSVCARRKEAMSPVCKVNCFDWVGSTLMPFEFYHHEFAAGFWPSE